MQLIFYKSKIIIINVQSYQLGGSENAPLLTYAQPRVFVILQHTCHVWTWTRTLTMHFCPTDGIQAIALLCEEPLGSNSFFVNKISNPILLGVSVLISDSPSGTDLRLPPQ